MPVRTSILSAKASLESQHFQIDRHPIDDVKSTASLCPCWHNSGAAWLHALTVSKQAHALAIVTCVPVSYALLPCRGGIASLATVGSVLVLVCAAALVVTKTNVVPFVKERWNMQLYEAVESEQSADAENPIPLRNIRVNNEAVPESPSSARSRSPARTTSLG